MLDCWQVREQEQILQRLKEDAEKEENNHKAQENLRLCQVDPPARTQFSSELLS